MTTLTLSVSVAAILIALAALLVAHTWKVLGEDLAARVDRLERERGLKPKLPGGVMNIGPRRPSCWPTRADYLDVFGRSIVAACRSVLNTSSPARRRGELVVDPIREAASSAVVKGKSKHARRKATVRWQHERRRRVRLGWDG